MKGHICRIYLPLKKKIVVYRDLRIHKAIPENEGLELEAEVTASFLTGVLPVIERFDMGTHIKAQIEKGPGRTKGYKNKRSDVDADDKAVETSERTNLLTPRTNHNA